MAAQHVVDEVELMALKELAETDAEEVDGANRDMAADLMALLRRLADLDGAGHPLSSDDLSWAEDLEGDAAQSAENMAAMAEDMLRGAAVLEARPGEDQAAAAELRRQAAQARARAADAGRVAAAARRLREKEMRRLAALDHVVDPSVLEFLLRRAAVAGGMGHASPAEVAAAERVEEEMATLRLRLIVAAMDFAERPGEEALVAALRRQADKAKATLEAVDAFRESMQRYQAAGGGEPGNARM
ncbi:unnamed protein product [Urochloa decumbens]|uniref:Uncharacterized protein n=1 Tax=Urochloa decumbens TaxID=240449 RepID=A0ABC8V703_9POAL